MSDIPQCLNRRYKAIDELIKDLSSQCSTNCCASDDPGIKLMCDFWKILDEDPSVNLAQVVQQRIGRDSESSTYAINQVNCYMAACCDKNQNKSEPKKHTCGKEKEADKKSQNKPSQSNAGELPLNKVLCNLKQVASFEQKCQIKVKNLLERQQELQDQIQILEQREYEGVQKLKEADCMWTCMEDGYKKKISESVERQNDLLKELKEAEAGNTKWRKHKKDLELQKNQVTKCHQNILDTVNTKTNDLKSIDAEINNFEAHIKCTKNDLEVSNKSLENKKKVSDAKIAKIAAEASKLEKTLKEKQEHLRQKELEGNNYVKETRDDLQNLNKLLLQLKLENENLLAKKETTLTEIDMFKQSSDECKDKCEIKQKSIVEETKDLDKKIAEFKLKCIQCHQCTDTTDIRKFCTDCARCLKERECLYSNGECNVDQSLDCVCMTVKQKLMDNVFDNMHSILLKEVDTINGKLVGDEILSCLRRSRNGKIDSSTRQLLKDFILLTIKRNMKFTVIGGAIKTRCEMDVDIHKQLMLCLNQIEVIEPEKSKIDRATGVKKAPCKGMDNSVECFCPKGPNKCVCTKNVLPPLDEAIQNTEFKEENTDRVCGNASAACGEDTEMRVPSAVGREVASWRPEPCSEPTCQFKNMRAAQCVLGPEIISPPTKKAVLDVDSYKFDPISTGTNVNSKDAKQLKAESNCISGKHPLTNVIKVTPNIIDQEISEVSNEIKIMKEIDSKEPLKAMLYEESQNVQDVKDVLRENEEIIKKMENQLQKECNRNKIMTKSNQRDSFTKFLLETFQRRIKTCKKSDPQNKENIFAVTITGGERTPLLALKEIGPGKFEVLLDKEFEKDYAKLINNYECNDRTAHANLLKSPSGQYHIINLDRNMNNVGDKALIVKSFSGNLQVLVDKLSKTNELPAKAVIHPECIKHLLKEMPAKICIDKISNRNCKQYQSVNDLKLNDEVRLNIKNCDDLLIDHSVVLKKKRSGEYSLVLNKESRKIFVKKVKDSLNTSKGDIPIKVTASGIIIIDVNTVKNNAIRNGYLKVTPSGDISLLFKDLKIQTSENNILDKVKKCCCRAVSTSCNGQKDDSTCDFANCVCKNSCLQNKNWFELDNSTSSSKTKCGIDITNTNIYNCFNFFDYFHDESFKSENSSGITNDFGKFLNDESVNKCYNYSNPVDSYENNLTERAIYAHTSSHWTTIENLPPQLPPFLKNFTYVQ